ncbi:hypothetical protein BWP39_15405 [Paraburkholderia acidicola]|uniref:Uncharacterized protein n=1 Tax=Paraburkholderia acidicola TaxID=1912599 RepID=A0A2A4F037_9BURK|nr:hypothetical protein [Paraburkholderia acidicola]PCE25914.1 hypothetical protein BWP39_15405 [Paraburkholderia acidicola]
MKKDSTPRRIVSLIASIVVPIVGVILLGRRGVGLIVYEGELARELFSDFGLHGWALTAVPLLCAFVAGWFGWRYFYGRWRVMALLTCAAFIGDMTLHVVAPNLEERIRQFGRPVCEMSDDGTHDINCSP